MLLRAQGVERAARGRGGGADRGQRGRAAANNGQPRGVRGHGVRRQDQHPVGAGEPRVRRVPEEDGAEGGLRRRRGRGGDREAGLAGVDAAP